MRFLCFITILMCLAASPALAQNGQGNGNGQSNGNENGASNGQGNGNGNGNGNSAGNGNGNGEHNSNGQSNGNGSSDAQSGTISTGSDTVETLHYTPDDARDAVSAGKAVSLTSLLPDLQERAGGEVIDAEMVNTRGILVYIVTMLRTDGRVTQEYYYAQSGRFIGSEP
ncbi:PepSY domain-containing protein [Devosia riboflavina]